MKKLFCFLFCLSTTLLSSQSLLPGSKFYDSIREMDFETREKHIQEEFRKGNYPEFLKNFQKITTHQKDAEGNMREVTIFVSPQYLAIGNIEDHFIIPMGPHTAQHIASSLDASLPTPKVVDIVYEAATLKLKPFTYYPRGNRNETVDILYDHSRVIQAQNKAAGFTPKTFTAGTKKDIVISPKLADERRPQHVIIYGWHKLDGKPIQPESNIHIDTYVDYSHGVRLISNRVLVDGKEYRYTGILKDKLLFSLLSNSGTPLTQTEYEKKNNKE